MEALDLSGRSTPTYSVMLLHGWLSGTDQGFLVWPELS